mgnify:CR=1 FL=1
MRLGKPNIIQEVNSMITITTTGDFDHFKGYLKRLASGDKNTAILERYAQEGVNLLYEATPKRTGLTASSWDYEIKKTSKGYIIYWTNSNINKTANIALILQTGHGTRTGGYVHGIDYINPAISNVFKALADDLWKEMTSV